MHQSITLMNKPTSSLNGEVPLKTSLLPSKLVCIGRNYVEHIHELGNEIPDEMVVFIKPNTAISPILHSTHQSETLHYEGELCFIVQNGRFSAVGFGLDLTKRTLQSKLKDKGLPWERAKAFDGAAVFSDFVEISDINEQLTLELSINDTVTQQGGVNLMMYKPDVILQELTSFITLIDNDVVMTGTPKGVGALTKGDLFTGKVYQADKLLVEHSWLVE